MALVQKLKWFKKIYHRSNFYPTKPLKQTLREKTKDNIGSPVTNNSIIIYTRGDTSLISKSIILKPISQSKRRLTCIINGRTHRNEFEVPISDTKSDVGLSIADAVKKHPYVRCHEDREGSHHHPAEKSTQTEDFSLSVLTPLSGTCLWKSKSTQTDSLENETNSKGTQTEQVQDYDAYLIHSSTICDVSRIESVVQKLEDRGVRCFFTPRDMLPGMCIMDFKFSTIHQSSKTIVCITESFLADPMCQLELSWAIFHECEEGRKILIPLKFDKDVAVPQSIKNRSCVSVDEKEFLPRILKAMGTKFENGSEDARPTYNQLVSQNRKLKMQVKFLERIKRKLIKQQLMPPKIFQADEYGVCHILS